VVGHYERRGASVLLLLAQEADDPQVRAITDGGKQLHRRWVEEVFADHRPDDALVDLLVVATDLYTWKVLRLDRGLSRAQTEARMRALVRAVLASAHGRADRR
jgi:predicted acylesterase/phospholipase RssA